MKLFLLALIFPVAAHASICREQRDSQDAVSRISCPHRSVRIKDNSFAGRPVNYQLPSGPAPRGGWPVAFVFQGSWFPVEFSRFRGLPFGAFNEVRLIQKLLDSGFAVIAPHALLSVGWETNIVGLNEPYRRSSDYMLMKNLLREITAGRLGSLNAKRLYATGISGGGYQTSRMALAFPGRFRALAIQSAAFADCLGALCSLPDTLPADHPPTLFLHGALDMAVPAATSRRYYEMLQEQKISTDYILDENVGHAWLEAAPDAITDWFLRN